MQVGFKTDIGNHRSINEDAFFASVTENLFIIADGVGGCNSGEVASSFAVREIAAYLKQNRPDASNDDSGIFRCFEECLNYVNQYLYDYAKTKTDLNGMATTVVIAYVDESMVYIANIGDSRVYRIRNKEIVQITQDHTLVSEYVKRGKITAEEAKNHPQKNIITRALGSNETVEADFYKIDIEKNDVFIMCTDGLYGELSDKEICRTVLSHDNMQEACNALVQYSIEKSGSDNITVICFKV